MTRIPAIAKLMVPVVLSAGVVAGFFVARSGDASVAAKRLVVRTAENPTLHRKVLVSPKGLTLYSLSVERRGRFICTDTVCLSLWKPLVVRTGTIPTGASRLGTLERPDGRRQVSFRGHPLYSFAGDHKPGDVKGNGFKDVGVWRPASPSPSSSAASPPPPSPYPSYPGYGG
jgi:predicted lipoprotein with Yx(FWY)xxD motif